MRSCQLVGLRYLRQFPKRYSIKSPSTYERLARWPVRSPSLTLMEKMLASSPLRIWWHLLRGPTTYLVSSKSWIGRLMAQGAHRPHGEGAKILPEPNDTGSRKPVHNLVARPARV